MLAEASPSFIVTVGDRPVDVVGRGGCTATTPLPELKVMIEARLVDEVHAGLDVVADAALAGEVPREVVAELPLLLLGASAACWALADRRRRSGTSGTGSWLLAVMSFAKSAYWKMNSFSLLPPSTQLWFRLTELNVVRAVAPVARRRGWGWRRRAASSGCGRSAPTGSCVGLMFAVTFTLSSVLAVRRGVDAVLRREQALWC